MNKGLVKYLFISVLTVSFFSAKAQTFFSEQEENLIFYSPEIAPTAVCVGDLENDGDLDILSFFEKKFRFYSHVDGSGDFIEKEIITAEDDWILSVSIADLNNDGKPDILAASYNNDKIIWYQNEGDARFGSQITISDSAKGAISIYAADLDNDNDLDVVSASLWDNKIAWYENQGDGTFNEQQIITIKAEGARYVHVADINGDKLLDVISASIYDNKIAWYENQGEGVFGEEQIITNEVSRTLCVYTADIDGDGNTDVLSASEWDNKIAWYRNDGNGSFGEQQVISNQMEKAQFVFAADLDRDNDFDVMSASLTDNKIAWYENKGIGEFGEQMVVTNHADMPGFVYATDVDGDGYNDIVSASTDFKIAWYENTLPMNILSNPKDTTVFPGQNLTFSVIADSVKSYVWQCKQGNDFYNLTNSEEYLGVNSSALKISSATFDMQKNQYRCLTINGSDSLSSSIAVLTVKDTISPVFISEHPNTVLMAQTGCLASLPDFTIESEVTDNSYHNVVITQTPPANNLVAGTGLEITLTATDEAGNSSQVKFSVDVVDQTPPVISNISDILDLELADNGGIIVPDFTGFANISDNCSDEGGIKIIQEPAPQSTVSNDGGKIGVTIRAFDEAGNSSEITFEAQAFDRIAPSITYSENDFTVDAIADCYAYMPDLSDSIQVSDNLDEASELIISQTPAPYSMISGNNNQVSLTASDKAGNLSEVIFNVRVGDLSEPVLKCANDQLIALDQGQTSYTVSGFDFDVLSVEDNCRILSIKNNINNSTTLNQVEFPMDTTYVEWTVTDEAGNVSRCGFNVIVNILSGIGAVHQSDIKVYPNPTTGEVYIDSSIPIQRIQILDVKGSLLLEQMGYQNKEILNISDFHRGTYLLKVYTEEIDYNIKIMKQP